ncbi:hypothetical protein BC938DRAFT_483162 [Jimgerdemannia flammicorona]|nr:hypothetical protein BC938DRAFT_483162 [Jimgerdemannia flammicorona]
MSDVGTGTPHLLDSTMETPLPGNSTTSNWLRYLLTDSALPTGGFVASSGLESAYQSGLITNSTSLSSFVATSSHTFAHSTIGFVKAGWVITSDGGIWKSTSERIEALRELDDVCEATMVINAVAKRASLAQGVAMLTLYTKCFAGADGKLEKDELIKEWKNEIRAGRSYGHYSVCFGLVCSSLGVDTYDTLHMWLYLYARTLFSSAVRLNIIGPYQAQRFLLDSKPYVESALHKTQHMTVDDCCQTDPVLDVCQGLHDRLYSRLFNS